MQQDPHLLVYRASAGSGKTFTLAVEYIRQLIEDPFAYRHILAVTFTNKATTEMKERILSQLYGIAHHDPKSTDYLKKIQETSSKSEKEIREIAAQALKNIIHDYSRFRITTIDSFFQTVMRNLARELELGTNLNVELNQKESISEAVDAMIDKLDHNSPVLHWIMEYIDNRIEDSKRWNVSKEIKSFGENLFNESYLEKGLELRKLLENTETIGSFRKRLIELKQEITDNMKGFNEHFVEVLADNGLEPTELIKGKLGIASYFNKLALGNFDDNNRNATVNKCLEDAVNWAAKTSPKRDIIIALAKQELMEILELAEMNRSRALKITLSCDMAVRYLYHLPLLVYIDNELRYQNALHNRFLLSETNALLHNLIGKGDASFIYEKIGTSINVVMIDEFQDTSRLQWENFHLLLEECLAQYQGSLIVGDIKQSIYRWRNGDWKILAGLNHDSTLHTLEKTLDTNWRSDENIIRFNNLFFTIACALLAAPNDDAKKDAFPQILEIYNDVEQKYKTNGSGYVQVSLIKRNGKTEDYREDVLKVLTQQVNTLISNGIKQNQIAILIRKKKYIPLIADYFDKHTNFHIVSDEAFQLDASLSVCMLIDCLRILANNDDVIACARLAVAYQKEIRKSETDLNTILLQGADHFLPEAFINHLNEWVIMPLYELLERLFFLFNMEKIENQDAYICAFYDSVTDYLSTKSSELTAFLKYWDETLHSKTIPSGEPEGIRIMSIHKAKGLEFHTVLIPFCDWKSENENNNNLVWCPAPLSEQNESIFGEMPLLPINYNSKMKDSVYKDSYLEEQHNLWVDNMNLLYVAFTRACKNMFIWGEKNKSGSVSEWIQQTLEVLPEDEIRRKDVLMGSILQQENPDTDDDETEISIYEYGELDFSDNIVSKAKKSTEQKDTSHNRLTATSDSVSITLNSLQDASKINFQQSNRSAAFISSEGDDEEVNYAERGNLLHYLFANIKKATDLPLALEQLRFEGLFRCDEEEQQIKRLATDILQIPQIKEWFGADWEVYNECSIIYSKTDGHVTTERPDRVMKCGERMIVLDFKFGKKSSKHQEQVLSYMKLLRQMGYKQVNGYLLYGYNRELIEVTETTN